MVKALIRRTAEIAGLNAISRDKYLTEVGAEFNSYINLTSPPSIWCSWREAHDEIIRDRFKELACDVQIIPDLPFKTYTYTKTGVHIVDQWDRDERECEVTPLALKFSKNSKTWTARMPMTMHVLKSLRLQGDYITRVEIRASSVIWARKLTPKTGQQFSITNPGNMCWPTFFMVFNEGIDISIDAPSDALPAAQVVWYTLTQDDLDTYSRSTGMYSLNFDGEDSGQRIAKFMCGTAGSALNFWSPREATVEEERENEEVIKRYQDQFRKEAEVINSAIPEPTTFSVACIS